MAIIKCNECEKEISDKAHSCPNCGSPTKWGNNIEKKKRRTRRGNVQGIGFLIVIFSIFLGLTIIGFPIAIPLGIVGSVILLIGFII